MLFRPAAFFAVFMISASSGFCETINLRNSCQKWEHIPASETLKSPIAALLQCSNDDHTWLAVQIMCFPKTAEIEFRYQPSYPVNVSVLKTDETQTTVSATTQDSAPTQNNEVSTPEQNDTVPALIPLAEKEMLFFDFPKLGVTSVVKYDPDAMDWSYTEKEPLAPLFRSLITANYADVSMLALDVKERLPLRGSTRAIGPVVETCRIAKRNIEREAAELASQSQN